MTTELFHIIDDGVAILRLRGKRYRQTKIYRRGQDVFADPGGGYVRLLSGGGTTDPAIGWLAVEGPGVTFRGSRIPTYVGDAEVQPGAQAA